MRPRDLHVGELVLIRRKVTKGKGQKKEPAAWIGPGKIIAIESSKPENESSFGHLTHVSYNGRIWGCAAEQLQPLYPSAVSARKLLEQEGHVSPPDPGKAQDIRAEAPLPGEEVEPPPRDIPPGGFVSPPEGFRVPGG